MLKYPLTISKLEGDCARITEKVFQIEFKGTKVAPNYKDVKARLLGLKKTPPPAAEPVKKDPKKKE